MVGLMLCVTLAQGRTAPLELSAGLKALHFEIPRQFIAMTRSQVGRIQVATWAASTELSLSEVSALFRSEWVADGSSRFTRRVGKVDQVAWLGEQNDGVHKNVMVSLMEYPPADRTIPEDWPLDFKKGLYRIIPDAIPSLHGVQPSRAESTLNPAGWGASATFLVKVSAMQIDAEIQRALPGFSKVTAEDQTMYSRGSNNPTFIRSRSLISIGYKPQDGEMLVTERWTPGFGDFAREEPASGFTAIQAMPQTKLPGILGSDYGYAMVSPAGAFGRRGLNWNFTVEVPYDKLKAAFLKAGAKINEPHISRGQLSPIGPKATLAFELSGTNSRVNGNVSSGRMSFTKEVPKGWQPTADVAGFREPIRVDEDTFSTIVAYETPVNKKGSWPSKASYSWPLAPRLGEPPLPEMKVEPESVSFSEGDIRVVNAMWRIKVSAARAEELKAFTFRQRPAPGLTTVSVSIMNGTAIISAEYRLQK